MKKSSEDTQAMLTLMLQELKIVYTNKSSDEYKHAGDITNNGKRRQSDKYLRRLF